MAINEAQVHAVAARLDQEGRKVSVLAVRDVLGSGSYSTIQKYLKTYSGEPMADVSDVPNDLMPVFQSIWARAVHTATERAKLEISAAMVERDAAIDERDQLLVLLDAKEKELTKLQKDLQKSEKNCERLMDLLDKLKLG